MKEIEIKSNSNCVNLDDCKLVREGIKIVTQLLLRLRKKYIFMSSDLVSISIFSTSFNLKSTNFPSQLFAIVNIITMVKRVKDLFIFDY